MEIIQRLLGNAGAYTKLLTPKNRPPKKKKRFRIDRGAQREELWPKKSPCRCCS